MHRGVTEARTGHGWDAVTELLPVFVGGAHIWRCIPPADVLYLHGHECITREETPHPHKQQTWVRGPFEAHRTLAKP